MSSRRLETIKLTGNFKLGEEIPLPFELYRKIVNELLNYAHCKGITSFKRLKSEKYQEFRAKHPKLPSHYIYTACQMACSIYKSFRKLKRRGKVKKDKPEFKKSVIMLDDHLFSIDLEHWKVSLVTLGGRKEVKLLHGTYHEKFRNMRTGQGWIVKRDGGLYLKVVFSKEVEVSEPNGKAIAVDINENNATFGSNNHIEQMVTRERIIRTTYFLKRRKIQSKPKLNEKPILEKYKGRESRRIKEIYHKVADKIIKMAKEEGANTIVLENLKNIRRGIKESKKLNGRLHRWSFRKLQHIIEYKARLNGLNVVYVYAKGSSSYCPICGEKLSSNGYRRMSCKKCGLEEDRDVIAVLNLLKRYQMDVGASSVHPESPPMTRGGKTSLSNVPKVSEGQNGIIPPASATLGWRLLGPKLAYYMLTCERLSVEDAEDIGLVHLVVDKERFEEEVLGVCEKILRNHYEALRETKRMISSQKLLEILEYGYLQVVEWACKEHFVRGAREFLKTKKLPEWR